MHAHIYVISCPFSSFYLCNMMLKDMYTDKQVVDTHTHTHTHTQSCTLDWAEFITIFKNPHLYAFQIKALPPLFF